MIKALLQLIGILVIVGFATGVFNLKDETVSLDRDRASAVTAQARQVVENITSANSTSIK
jgi:hypothetical protein